MKNLMGLRVNLLHTIDPETGKNEYTPQIVMILLRTKYVQNGSDSIDIVPVCKTKTVRFATNLQGLENLKTFVDGLITEIKQIQEQ
jgi:hypothetical protein